MTRFSALFLLFIAAPLAAAAPLPLGAFVDPGQFEMIKISPDGAHLAATVPLEGRVVLVIFRREDMKQTASVNLEDEALVADFEWVNPRQVVYSVAGKEGSLAAPVANPFLYIVGADGSDARPINRQHAMWLVDSLRDEEDFVLVGHEGASGAEGLSRLDLRTGRVGANRVKSPLHSGSHYADHAGNTPLFTGYFASELYPRLYLREGGDWIPLNVEGESGERVYVSGFSADNTKAYLIVEHRKGTDGFYELDLATRERRLLHRHESVDLDDALLSPIDGDVIALRYLDGGVPTLHVLKPEDRFAKERQKLARAFPGSFVYPTSYTHDGDTAVYLVSSDVNSGEFYLVDHGTGKAHFIASANDAQDPRTMSPMRSVRIQARDGVSMEGFLTVPATRPAGQTGPLVVMPHGGPKGVFDQWGFDPEVQMLASRGYAVLQVNFRGSGNYGQAFRESGNGQWGSGMVDDIVDATKWAIAQKVSTPGRICMYGASYGAYASMMALARAPELYACGIGNVGVYDIRKMYTDKTIGTRYSQEYFDQLIGTRDMEGISPYRHAAAIRVPVLLGAGEEDTIAPPEQTDIMRNALVRAGGTVDVVEYEGEGHGNYLEKNRADWARRVLAMLDRTIGPGAAAAKPAAP